MNTSLKRKLIFGLVLGFLCYVIFAFLADLDELLRVGGLFSWSIFPAILALAVGNYLIRLGRWHIYLRNLKIEISFKHSAVVFFSGLAMSVSPGKFGELLKAQYVKNINGTKRRRTAPVILAERLTDLIGVLILASFGVFHFNYGEVVFFAVLALIVLALVVISSRKLSLWAIRLLKPIPLIGRRVHKLEDAYDNIAVLMKAGLLLPSTLLSLLAWGCEGIGFFLVINAFPGVEVSLQTAFFIYAFAILVGAVSMLPGGLGATEGIMAGLLVLLDVPAAEAIGATFIIRLATLWFAVAIGLICSTIWHRTLEGTHINDLEENENSVE